MQLKWNATGPGTLSAQGKYGHYRITPLHTGGYDVHRGPFQLGHVTTTDAGKALAEAEEGVRKPRKSSYEKMFEQPLKDGA